MTSRAILRLKKLAPPLAVVALPPIEAANSVPESSIGRLRGGVVRRALQAQDVSALVDMDLLTLKARAAIEAGWLFEQSQNGVRDDLGLVAACSLGTTLEDIRDDWFYLNRRAIHVIRRESPY